MFNKDILEKKLKLYLVCGEGETTDSLFAKAEAALDGGVTALQLRVKSWPARDFLEAARTLAGMAKRRDALFIVNDRIDIALACGADGVHLGQEDMPVDAARRMVPADFIIGASVHTNELAAEARERGADYLGCGSVFATGTKNNALVIGPEGVRETLNGIGLPSVAIGGITLDNLNLLADSGCSGISLVSEIMGSPDPREKARELLKEINRVFARTAG